MHPQGGCGFTRHGTYERVNPPGTRIARWYCRQGHCTFSLLPDCLAARGSGTLIEFEAVVNDTEAARSLEAAAAACRPDIELPGVLRWLRRRRQVRDGDPGDPAGFDADGFPVNQFTDSERLSPLLGRRVGIARVTRSGRRASGALTPTAGFFTPAQPRR